MFGTEKSMVSDRREPKSGAGGHGPGLGIQVIEWDAGLAGAVAGMLLADSGADVTFIEPPDGSPLRSTQWWPVVSRGKTTWVLEPGGASLQALDALIADSDAAIHSFPRDNAPLPALEASRASGSSEFSSLISCAITGFGDNGALPARDLLVAASTGRCDDQVGWDKGPCYIAHPIPSVVAGLTAVHGILAALLGRSRTGLGQRVETSLAAAALAVSEIIEIAGAPAERGLSRRPRGTSPLYSLYECADGGWIQLGCLHAGFVNRAVDVLGIGSIISRLRELPGFGDGVVPATDEVCDPFYDAVAAALLNKTAPEWLDEFARADVPVAPVLRSEDFLRHPQATINGLTVSVDASLGRVLQPGAFVRFADGPVRPEAAASEPSMARSPRPSAGGGGLGPSEQPKRSEAALSSPLEGVVVVEMANLIAGPMSGRCLADLGATVVKLESLGGDLFRQQGAPEFYPLNAGKLGLAMNLKTEQGISAASDILSRADVFLNNMRPGAAERLGLGYDAMRELNPRLVYCQVSAFGVAGPLAGFPGGDPLAGALTGMQAAQGGYGPRPVYTYGAPIDYTAGFLATAGILTALCRREQTGHGQFLETSLLDAGALLNAGAMTSYASRGPRADLPRTQQRRSALDGLYRTQTGWLALSVVGQREWHRFRSVLKKADEAISLPGNPSWLTDDELAQRIGEALRRRSAQAWCQQLLSAGVACSPVRVKRELRLSDPLVTANGGASSYPVRHGGRVSFIHSWLALSGGGSHCRGPAPELGEHSGEVLSRFGIDAQARQRLVELGIVADTREKDPHESSR
jgi:crotonobetainyl-CoA:carnitine CoA-transferase CaiB-like acyl-CoA transferase